MASPHPPQADTPRGRSARGNVIITAWLGVLPQPPRVAYTLRRPQPPPEICRRVATPDARPAATAALASTSGGRGGHRDLVEATRGVASGDALGGVRVGLLGRVWG
jgi:hypothetical protein